MTSYGLNICFLSTVHQYFACFPSASMESCRGMTTDALRSFLLFKISFLSRSLFESVFVIKQVWDLRSNSAAMEFHENNEYISALTCDEEEKTLLATR